MRSSGSSAWGAPNGGAARRRVGWAAGGLKVNYAIVPDLVFVPDIPQGFQDVDTFLSKFLDRPELKGRMEAARQRIEVSRAKTAEYKPALASLRREAGLSQKQLAEMIGTVQPVISMYEAGEREPSLKAIFLLAEALRVGFDRLLPALRNV